MGASFTGPAGFVLLLAYRLYTQSRVKHRTGAWVDKHDSNYYEPGEGGELRFKKESLAPLTVFWATTVISLLMIGNAFMFASMADMNQGLISMLFVVGAFYISAAFFWLFVEMLSLWKAAGIALMFIAIPMLAVGRSKDQLTATSSTIVTVGSETS